MRAVASVFNVHCMMCGRAAGHVRNGSFVRLPSAPPLAVRGGRSRCGFCGGNVYLEAEDSPVLPHAEAFQDEGIRRAS
jgi:hypothetical protein